MHSSGWKCAWREVRLPSDGQNSKGPHNLWHTFGRRLQAAGVPFETVKYSCITLTVTSPYIIPRQNWGN